MDVTVLKIWALALSVASVMTCPLHAVGGESRPSSVTIGSAEAYQGTYLMTIPITVQEANDLESFGMRIHFDSDLLRFAVGYSGPLTSDWDSLSVTNPDPGELLVYGKKGVGTTVSGTGELAILHFWCNQSGEGSPIGIVRLTGDLAEAETLDGTATCLNVVADGPVLSVSSITAICDGTVQVAFSYEGFTFPTSGFRFELAFDPSKVDFLGAQPGSETTDWAEISGEEVATGHLILQGTAGAGTPARGEILVLDFRCLKCPSTTLLNPVVTEGIFGLVIPGVIQCGEVVSAERLVVKRGLALCDGEGDVLVNLEGIAPHELEGVVTQLRFDPASLEIIEATRGESTSEWDIFSAHLILGATDIFQVAAFRGDRKEETKRTPSLEIARLRFRCEKCPAVTQITPEVAVISFLGSEEGLVEISSESGEFVCQEPLTNDRSDIDEDGDVNAKDMLLILESWRMLANTTFPTPTPTETPGGICGTLIEGIEGDCILLQTIFGPFLILGDIGDHSLGERVRVTGVLDTQCITFCQEGIPCFEIQSITECADSSPKDLTNNHSDLNQDGEVDSDDIFHILRDWKKQVLSSNSPTTTPTEFIIETSTFTPSPTPTDTEFCIPEYAWLDRDLPESCFPGIPFEVQFSIQGGTASITDVTETVPAGWDILSPTPFERMGDTYHWDRQILDYTILPPEVTVPGEYGFTGIVRSSHWCNGEVTSSISGDSTLICQAATPTPNPSTQTYRVSGSVAEFPSCTGLQRGASVTLEPGGYFGDTGETGFFSIEGVPEGTYMVSVSPSCNPFGCWEDQEITVSGVDVSVTLCPKAVPDLVPESMSIELESGDDCIIASTPLGVRAIVGNWGSGDAGTFVVRVNDSEQVVQGLKEGGDASLWFPGYDTSGEQVFLVDVYDQVKELHESGNQLSEVLPVPTIPPTCTLTPTPEQTPTPTPTSERGNLYADIEASPNPAQSGEPVTLNASSSEGGIFSFQWEFLGEAYGTTIRDASGSIASFLAPTVGAASTLTVQLTVRGVCCSPPVFDAADDTTLNIVVVP